MDRFSGDSVSDDISDSCLVQGNKHLRDRNREDVAAKLWNKSTAFGVGCKLYHGVFIGEIKEMEIRDEEANVQKECVERSWSQVHVKGRVEFVLKEKRKALKISLMRRNKEVFEHIDLEVNEAIRDLNTLYFQDSSDSQVVLHGLASRRDLASKRVWTSFRERESFLRHKARALWLVEGDSNSKFFHKEMKHQFIRNALLGLNSSGSWIDKVDLVKKLIKKHFSDMFCETFQCRPKLDGVSSERLSIHLYFGGTIFRGDVCRVVNEFHSIGYLPKVVTTFFLMLIPKVDSPGVLEEYRLICLIDSLYRILAKLLSVCLRCNIAQNDVWTDKRWWWQLDLLSEPVQWQEDFLLSELLLLL
ncbi:hypothetical protein KIW84_012165 [Lathyrus oleraceus]|uniref:Uncharacterized protein n=1 Tax=Pisum sativum TaxID=3888 RepID=A0A9D5GVU8_PEA|nr:hypothetical protein KIW84_012165 [Pisum sativum]